MFYWFFNEMNRAAERASKASKKLGAPPGKRPHLDSVIFLPEKGFKISTIFNSDIGDKGPN